jgi:hypothetical protein
MASIAAGGSHHVPWAFGLLSNAGRALNYASKLPIKL